MEALKGSLALATSWFQTSGFQNWERIDFCCVKPSGLWSFVLAAPGAECKLGDLWEARAQGSSQPLTDTMALGQECGTLAKTECQVVGHDKAATSVQAPVILDASQRARMGRAGRIRV